jgi:hypothetical protein
MKEFVVDVIENQEIVVAKNIMAKYKNSRQTLSRKSPWVIGTGLVLVVGMIELVVYLVNRNKGNKE